MPLIPANFKGNLSMKCAKTSKKGQKKKNAIKNEKTNSKTASTPEERLDTRQSTIETVKVISLKAIKPIENETGSSPGSKSDKRKSSMGSPSRSHSGSSSSSGSPSSPSSSSPAANKANPSGSTSSQSLNRSSQDKSNGSLSKKRRRKLGSSKSVRNIQAPRKRLKPSSKETETNGNENGSRPRGKKGDSGHLRKVRKKAYKKKKKKMREIGRKHPEFELTYDLLLGIRTSVSLINSSILRSSQFPSARGGISGVTLTSTGTLRSNASGFGSKDGAKNNYKSRTQSIGSSNASIMSDRSDSSDDDDDEQLEREFKSSKKFKFPSKGSSTTPAHFFNDFEFKDYCRSVFAQLRDWFGVKPEAYLVKLCGSFNLLEFISNSKSGQFFFYSHDGQFLIKSMTKSESRFLRKIMPDYFHYVQRQPNTLMTKFYGMYRVKAHSREAIYFCIMGSVFHTDLEIHKIYDLKGSTHGRAATAKDKENAVPVLKDLDFLDQRQIIRIGKTKAKIFKDQLRKDVELLRKLNIMDYSLLLGIHYKDVAARDALRARAEQQLQAQTEEDDDGGDGPISKQQSLVSHDDLVRQRREEKAKRIEELKHQVVTDVIIGHKNSFKSGDSKKKKKINQSEDISPLETGGNEIDNEKRGPHEFSVEHSLSDDGDDDEKDEKKMEEKNDDEGMDRLGSLPGGGAAAKTRKGTNGSMGGDTLKPSLPRLTSRRMSQIGMKSNFTVSSPFSNHFEIPELIDRRMLDKQQALDEDGDGDDEIHSNIFHAYHGGTSYIDEDGNTGNEVYFMGLIDILQLYNKRKKVENFLKGMQVKDKQTISAVPPQQYAKRMVDFLKDKIM